LWSLLITLAAFTFLLTIPSFADSQARIVRLSQVDGNVQIDRNTGQGYEKAFLNLPVTQGVKLRTGADGRAEIEFENGSTLRLAPDTVVEFSELALRDSGARSSLVGLIEGTAYLNFKGEKDEQFAVSFGQERLALTKPAHLRVELKDAIATAAVFKGDVEVESASGKVAIEKKHTATFDLTAEGRYTLASNLEPDPYDDWDKQQDKYHQQYSFSSASYSPYGYGSSDLNYYGSFYDVPGYGMMWQPYLVGAGWDPFMNGAWMWYPGFGYTWVSAYPWGWMPYRYGSWVFLSSYGGWFWQPGSTWAGWNTGPRIVNPPSTFVVPRPPSRPGQSLVVNRIALPAPGRVTQHGLQIRSDSAGLGIPRGSIRNLGRVSQQLGQPMGAGRGTYQSSAGGSAHGSGPSRLSAPRSSPPAHGSSFGGASHGAHSSVSAGSASHGSSHK
jgi:hypothetical protein